MNKLAITVLLLASTFATAKLPEEFLLRLQQASISIEQHDPDFYQKACTFAETSQAKYEFITTILRALEACEIKPVDAANVLNIGKCSLECAYLTLSRIRYGLAD